MSDTCKGVEWIKKLFGDCIVTTRDKVSFTMGMISNLIWFVESVPEIVVLCRTKDNTGISLFFFLFIVVGDLSGLIGNILTGLMATQMCTYLILLCFHVFLLLQYSYYRCKAKKLAVEVSDQEEDSNNLIVPAVVSACAVAVSASVDYGEPYRGEQIIGSLFGWVSGVIYTSSRIPQVALNFQRKFVLNLSPFYFVCTISGNITLLSSIFIRDNSAQYLWKQMPFIMGVLGPLCCDVITCFQMCIFGFSVQPLMRSGDDDNIDITVESSTSTEKKESTSTEKDSTN